MRRRWRVTLCAALYLGAGAATADDLTEGKEYYSQSCALCHQMIENDAVAGGPSEYLNYAMLPPFGPPLKGVYGRPAGQVQDFRYSPGFMKAAPDIVWNDETLDEFLKNSREMIPGTIMFFREPDPEKRRQVILYLKANG